MDLYPKYQINRVLILIRCIMQILYENGEFYMESVYCLGYINIWYKGFTLLHNFLLGVLQNYRNKV